MESETLIRYPGYTVIFFISPSETKGVLIIIAMVALLGLHALLGVVAPPEVGSLLSLLQQVSSPSDCSPRQARQIVRACEALEEAAADVRPSFPRDLMQVDGTWQLAFTSAANAAPEFVPDDLLPPEPPGPLRSLLSGLREGPLSPRQISQQINVLDRRIVNCVTLSPWPTGGVGSMLAAAPGPLGEVLTGLSEGSIRLELDHRFSVTGDGSDGRARRAAGTSSIQLALERVSRTLDAPTSAPGSLADLIPRETAYDIPSPLQGAVTRSFDTLYVDDRLRICRGPLGELSVFERETPPATDTASAVEGVQDPWTKAAVGNEDGPGDVEELWDESAGVWRVADEPSD